MGTTDALDFGVWHLIGFVMYIFGAPLALPMIAATLTGRIVKANADSVGVIALLCGVASIASVLVVVFPVAIVFGRYIEGAQMAVIHAVPMILFAAVAACLVWRNRSSGPRGRSAAH